MTKRRWIIIIILALVIIGLAIALVLSDFSGLPSSNQPDNIGNQNVDNNQKLPASNNDVQFFANQIKQYMPVEMEIRSLARTFAERYGSYSSDGDFANLDEIKILSTPAFQNQLDSLKTSSFDGFYGVTSKMLKIEDLQINEEDGSAEAELVMQRNETKDSKNLVYYQNLFLEFRQVNNNWLVSQASWQ